MSLRNPTVTVFPLGRATVMAVLIGISAGSCVPVFGQTAGLPGVGFYIERIDIRRGFPQKPVYAIAQDSKGYIWFGAGISLSGLTVTTSLCIRGPQIPPVS